MTMRSFYALRTNNSLEHTDERTGTRASSSRVYEPACWLVFVHVSRHINSTSVTLRVQTAVTSMKYHVCLTSAVKYGDLTGQT